MNIGSDFVVDTGAFYNEVSGEVAEAVGLKNYPYVNAIEEDVGTGTKSHVVRGCRVPLSIPGVLRGQRTFYLSNFRNPNYLF